MPTKYNSASRCHSILSKAARVGGGLATADAWASAFSVAGTRSVHRDIRVVRLLGFLEAEIRQTSAEMAQTDFDSTTYTPAIRAALASINISHLDQQWGLLGNNLSNDVLLAFQFCSHIIPSEGDQISAATLDSIETDLGAFEHNIGTSDLSEKIKAFFFRQIAIIENAILEYGVRGEKAFTYAMSEVAAEVSIDAEAATEAKKTPAFEELTAIWKRVQAVTSHTDTVVKLLAWGIVAHDAVAVLVGPI